MDLPDLTTLQCFLVLSKHLSFKKGAQAMYLSPAAFSDRIKRLETDLNAPLFERTTRHVKLTPLGVALIPHATRLIQEAWRWNEVIRSEGIESPYTLKIGTRFELGMSWLVPALSQLKHNQPHRSLELKWASDQEMLNLLHQGELDAMISSVRVNQDRLHTLPLHREEYVFVASSGLVLPAEPSLLSPTHVSSLTLIDTEASLPLFRYFLDALSTGETWHFKETELMGTIGAVRARVLANVGVAVLPLYFVKSDLEAGHLVHLRPNLQLHHDFFRLIWHQDQPRVNAIKQLVQELQCFPLT